MAVHSKYIRTMSLFSETKCILLLASARIQHWALTLSAYQYTIVYRSGKDNANQDVLSRLPLPETPAVIHVPPDTVFRIGETGRDTCKSHLHKADDRQGPSPVLSQNFPFAGLAQCGGRRGVEALC